ncbi:MAG: septation regulator SpoVG [Clostridia bacterium]|nr:septation regulator SpoVG [Clostridia bacterium]
MKITDIRIRIVKKDDNKLKAVASLTIDDCFAVHDIKVIEGNQGLFVAMPSRKTPEGNFKDIVHPLDTNTREEITKLVLAEYDKVLSESEGAETTAE